MCIVIRDQINQCRLKDFFTYIFLVLLYLSNQWCTAELFKASKGRIGEFCRLSFELKILPSLSHPVVILNRCGFLSSAKH